MIVRVPASSANLGPGFDVLGMAVSLYAEIGTADAGVPEGARRVDEHHPAAIAFRRCGGSGALWERTRIPAGRGLGFSGAVRVGGALLAVAGRDGAAGEVTDEHRYEVLPVVTELEGHADNVAASLFGGVVAAAGARVVRVPLAIDPAVVVWIPSFVTRTDESRRRLAGTVPFADAVFNVGRVGLLVAALAAGDVDALRDATQDRLHQQVRLDAVPASRAALEAALAAGAAAAWLSGSGPTVAALCEPGTVDAVVASMPGEGHTKVLQIDRRGAATGSP